MKLLLQTNEKRKVLGMRNREMNRCVVGESYQPREERNAVMR